MELVNVDKKVIERLIEESKIKPKKRAVHIVRSFKDEGLPSIMFSVLQPETYIHPHMHPSEKGKQILIAIKGKMIAIIFDEQGNITKHMILNPDEISYLEIPSRIFHTVVVLKPDTVLCELYMDNHQNHEEYKRCASWAPEELSMGYKQYLEELIAKVSRNSLD